MLARGIHDHPQFQLGLKATDRNRPVVRLRWANGVPPPVPGKGDHFPGWTIGLDGNDKYGDCGPTSVDNHRRLTTKFLAGAEADASQDEVFDLYRRSGNPNFNPTTDADDNGVDMSVMMAAVQSGGLAGVKTLGYAKLSDLSDASVMAAIDVFGGVLFAVDLQTAQQTQSGTANPVWDYKRSAEWGGHAIVAASWDKASGRIDVGSWAMRIGTTPAFRQHQLQEVWVPLWPEVVNSGKFFGSALDTTALANDWLALTGQPFPAPLPPTPPPPLPPVPPIPPVPPPVAGGLPFTLGRAEKAGTYYLMGPGGLTHLTLGANFPQGNFVANPAS